MHFKSPFLLFKQHKVYRSIPVLAILTIILFFSFLILIGENHLGNFPSLVFSALAAYFAYGALFFSHEKIRFDLFQARYSIYLNILEFLSLVIQYGAMPPNNQNEEAKKAFERFHESADKGFSGVGWHQSQALFGSEIADLLTEIHKLYAYYVSKSDIQDKFNEHESYQKWARMTIEELPLRFKPYIYFGDYKNVTF